MLKRLLITLVLGVCTQHLFSQTSNLSGKVQDTTANVAVKNAVVAVLSVKDSVLERFTRTDASGNFSLKNVNSGKHILMVMHPLFAEYIEDIETSGSDNTLGSIAVTPKSKLLEAVIIKSGSPIRIKGDTTVYTADSFKVSANANVEELLKKLPGIQVDKNGQIKAMGETVEKVLVDGEEFFGDDPGMAVKNLRADAVKEVQVFDKKSDQAEFTGIDDGQTKKTINLKLKENRKTGYFGKISTSGGLLKGIDDRYNNNIMFSTFKGKRKISAFVLQGNTGQDGLSWQDNEKYGGESENYSMSMDEDGGMMFMWRGGGSDDEPYVNTENGFIRNINAGVQYSNKWDDKKSLNFSPKFNSQIYDNTMSSYTRTPVLDTLTNENIFLNETASQKSHVNRYNVKLKGTYDVKIDTANSLKLTVGANFYHTESEEEKESFTKNDKGIYNNTSSSDSKTNSDKNALSANVLFKHKFKKARRTISVSSDWNRLANDGTSYLKSANLPYLNGSPGTSQDLDQMRDFEKATQKLSSKVIYTEPLAKKYALEIGYEFSYSAGNNDQVTYAYNSLTGRYDTKVDSLTNDFDQRISIHRPSAKLNYTGKKLKATIGYGFGFTHFDLKDNSVNRDYIRNYTNFFPAANLNYSYKANHNLRFSYNGNTQQPTLNQLQPLTNNNDYFNQYIGNPNLKPSFTNSFNIQHNGYNFIKDIWTYQSINFTQTSNAITNSQTINTSTGRTVSQPVNTNGNYNLSIWAGTGFKIKKIDTRFNFNPNLSYMKSANVINSVTSYAKNLSTGLSVWISKGKDKKYDISVGNDFSYNNNKTTQFNPKTNGNVNTSINYITNTLQSYVTVYIHKVWSISTDYQYYIRQKTTQFDSNIDNHMWNASLQRTFKNNEFTVFFKVRDILNQNIGVDRSFNGNVYKEERNDRLKRYWLVGFSWDFKNKGAKAATPGS